MSKQEEKLIEELTQAANGLEVDISTTESIINGNYGTMSPYVEKQILDLQKSLASKLHTIRETLKTVRTLTGA